MNILVNIKNFILKLFGKKKDKKDKKDNSEDIYPLW